RVEDLIVVEDFASQLSRPKTRELVEAMTRWGVSSREKVLLIVGDRDDNVYLSARNVPTLKLIGASGLNVYDLLNADKIVVTASALTKIQEVYSDD
ncbi:MAG: 50S ribosomal protein L4, partial [Microcoleus sp. SIO2G3]|nr:50S ribosomal protein L4 [Microcoleus sp. SIO2G3]